MIDSLERLRDVQRAGTGFIAITDTASRPRLHRAGCQAIKEEQFFEVKVIQNAGRNGAYYFTRDADAASARWPDLHVHGCV